MGTLNIKYCPDSIERRIKMNRSGSFFKRLFILFIAVIAIYFLTIVSFQVAFGTQTPFMVVVSNSMYPTLKINDIIIVKNVPIDDIQVGDIIVFKSPLNPQTPIVHRVINIIEDVGGSKIFITKGDNNPTPDPWTVSEDLILGKVIYVVPQIGVIPKILNAYPTLKYALAALIIAIIIVSEYIDYVKSRNEEIGIDEEPEETLEGGETEV